MFDFGDLLDPEPSDEALDENSSVEESTMFVPDSMLSPLNEIAAENTPLGNNNTSEAPATATTEAGGIKAPSKGILKKTKFVDPPPQYTKPKVTTVDSMMSGRNDFSESQRQQQPFSPTMHTSNQTKGFANSNVLSPTVHRSNQTAATTKPPTFESTNNPYTKLETLEISDESAEKAAAWAIHFALIFFCVLILTCVLLTFKVIRDYGFLTLVLMACVLAFCGFLACFVDSTILSENPKLKPVRQKIITVARTTKKLLEEEYHLFLNDWKEHHLFLKQFGENDGIGDHDLLPTTTTRTKRKKSKVFKMIKPLLGLRKKFGDKRRRRQNTTGASALESESPAGYQAPEI